MLKLITCLSLLFAANKAQAQTAEDSVKKVVNNLFTAMITSDSTLLKTCFADGAILQTISKKAGVEIKSEPLSEFVSLVGTQAKGSLDERIQFDVIRIDDDLAIAWTPYSFYYKSVFSHCGVNSFQLVRIGGAWKIQYLVDTRRKNDCK
ncbi:MAG: nuclear transport factor 2 family protein [Ferruginibacter sp.]